HPLGNFSISQYSAIGIHRDEIRLRYVIDMAEIPTFQEIQENGIVSRAGDPSLEAYLVRKSELLRDGLRLEVDGQRLSLKTEKREIVFPLGAGGLPTLKIDISYKAKRADDSKNREYQLSYRDDNFPGRAGWKEIIAVAAPGTEILNSSVSQVDRSSELNDYPASLLSTPPQQKEALVAFSAKDSTIINGVVAADSQAANAHSPVQLQANRQGTVRNSFTELMATRHLSIRVVIFALVVAAGLGAFHALEPGHGKTLVAAYLVGSRGTVQHAFLLGLIVTVAHTAGVYLLGAVTLYASQYIVPERLYPWLGTVSGVLIAGLGAVLLVRCYRGKAAISSHHHHHHADHSHSHDHHHDHHDHVHHFGHTHHHHDLNRRVSLRELLTLGISGGIVPCPAALVVLLSAVSMQRVGFGLLLIVAFSVGLAAVLITIGLFMVYARDFVSRFQTEDRVLTRWLPLASSTFITLFGFGLVIQSVAGAGYFAG
ncbi:MAG TPA: high-affinity nickel-transporter, partial [Candidatus Binatia bacterium]|nr:high-affinity nickel-transporter [Candidatus Binatia bacterium]